MNAEKIFEILNYVNMAIGILFLPLFLTQLFNLLFLWIKPKRFAVSDEKKKIAILIPAHNEELVIGNTIKKLKEQDYPDDKYDIFVVADNCTDNTAKIAREMGAIVFERVDNDPNHRRAAFPMHLGYTKILTEYKGVYDAVIKFDADNVAKEDYISRMNDALCAGCEIARGFLSSSNYNTNLISAINSAFVVRCSLLQCKVKERFNLNVNLTGCGLMVSTKVLDRIGGWDSFSIGDDVEFALRRAIDGDRLHFVYDAIMYEEQTTTYKDTFNRLKRIAKGSNRTFWKLGPKVFARVYKNLGNFDLVTDLMVMPLSIVSILWFPSWFIASLCLSTIPSVNWTLLSQVLMWTGIGFGIIFTAQFILVTAYIYIVEYKKFKVQKLKYRAAVILLMPFFSMLYTVAAFAGILGKTRWNAIKREDPNKNN